MTIQNKQVLKNTGFRPENGQILISSEHLQTELTAIQKRWKDISFSGISRGGNPLFRRTRLIFKKRYKKQVFNTDIIFSHLLQGEELINFVTDFRNESLQLFAEYVKRT